jgi:hypothetical protein
MAGWQRHTYGSQQCQTQFRKPHNEADHKVCGSFVVLSVVDAGQGLNFKIIRKTKNSAKHILVAIVGRAAGGLHALVHHRLGHTRIATMKRLDCASSFISNMKSRESLGLSTNFFRSAERTSTTSRPHKLSCAFGVQ